MIFQSAATVAEGAFSVDHVIIYGFMSILGASKAVELLRDFGIIPNKKLNGKPREVVASVNLGNTEVLELLRGIRDDIRFVAEDTRQRQLADRVSRK